MLLKIPTLALYTSPMSVQALQSRSCLTYVRVPCVRVRVTLCLAFYRQSVRFGDKPLEAPGQTFFSQLNICGHSPYITSSLTRGWICHLQRLVVLASAFTLWFVSRGTRDHILLSQIRDFHFCRLLRLSGLRCPPFITSGSTESKSPPPTIPLSLRAYSLLRKCA
jgi:hypothetical protein